MTIALFSAAFLQGLLGSWHCPGMCGPIAQVLYSGGGRSLPINLVYNFGRTLSYFSVGLLLGLTGGLLNTVLLSRAAAILGGVLIALFGCAYLFSGSLSSRFALPEAFVRRLGSFLRDGRGRLPVALVFGMSSGLLPCGLLLPAYALALSTGDALTGATAMVFFSLGTYPAMIAVGGAGAWFWRRMQMPGIRRAFGAFLILFGAVTIVWRVYVPHEHGAHGVHDAPGIHGTHNAAESHNGNYANSYNGHYTPGSQNDAPAHAHESPASNHPAHIPADSHDAHAHPDMQP